MLSGKAASLLDQRIRSLPGVLEEKSRWKHEKAYVVAGKEFVHFHKSNEIDVRLTLAVLNPNRHKLEEDPRIKLRPRRSDWIAISLRTSKDVEFAFGIVKQAWRANGGSNDY